MRYYWNTRILASASKPRSDDGVTKKRSKKGVEKAKCLVSLKLVRRGSSVVKESVLSQCH